MGRRHIHWSAARMFGLDVANNNVVAWLAERATAIVLLPLSVWLVASVIAHTGSDSRSVCSAQLKSRSDCSCCQITDRLPNVLEPPGLLPKQDAR